ncbi:MAG TPA: hypothetical protein VMH80_15440 [Bryobacteraceae bacterium]|nr:hypothetical protein [Bryobacteraceae bacterium]
MYKLVHSVAVAAVALVLPIAALADITDKTVTLSSGQILDLDAGAVVSSGGDLKWDGTSLTPQGSAIAADGSSFGLTGSAGYSNLNSTLLAQFASLLFSSSPITPAANDVIGVKTHGGHYAKILVTSLGSSIGLKFTTYGVSGSGGGGGSNPPMITSVVNNYSYIPDGFANSGVSPGSIITIFGSDMSDSPPTVTLQSSAAPGIPKTLEGATLSVKVGSTTVTPGMYYATPSQIAAVLPSNTPTGSATITVSYKGNTSNAFSFQVVPAALGLDTYYGTGTGLITATNANTGALYNFTNSVKPGETIVLWGSGLGADTPDSDTVFTNSPHSVNTAMKIYFGGVTGTVLYQGSSGYPGLNQINVTVPANAPTGCYVSVVAVLGTGASTTTSNFLLLPISVSGGECNDSILGISGSEISMLSGQSTVKTGSVTVGQSVTPKSDTDNTPQTNNVAFASFSKDTGSSYEVSGSSFTLPCNVTEVISSGGSGSSTGLDAGNISVTGPTGTFQLMTIPLLKGYYTAQLPANAITASGGDFTFNGSGGADVGSFSATITLPNPLLQWTNQSAGATINRGTGVEVDWTGGAPGSFVAISGDSFNLDTEASGSFICIAPQSALKFVVPNYVLYNLPAGAGHLSVGNDSGLGTFSANGLDSGLKFGYTSTQINSTYK